MKIAICLSGHVRTYKKTISNFLQLKKFLEQFADIDIFISTWDTINSNSSWSRSLNNTSENNQEINIEEINEFYKPKKINIQNFNKLKRLFFTKNFTIFNPPNDLKDSRRGTSELLYAIPQFYKIFDCNSLKLENEIEKNFEYDIVIRQRFDHLFTNFIDITNLNKDIVYIGINSKYDLQDPKWTLSNGYSTCDQYAIGNSSNMNSYSSVYTNLTHLLKEKTYSECGERILWEHLNYLNIKTETCMENSISLLRE
jgi:hypothetical protein